MTKLTQMVNNLRNQPHDERITNARNSASWTALVTLFVTYVALAIGYSVMKITVPGTVQLLFYIPLVTFFLLNMRQEGFQFTLPWLKETNTTLEQPATIRSVPWLIIVTGILGQIIYNLPNQAFYITGTPTFPLGLYTLFNVISITLGIASVILGFYVANRIKRGDRLFLGLTKWYSLIVGLSGLVTLISNTNQHGPYVITAADAFFTLSYLWIAYTIGKYGKQMVTDGKSYEQEPSYDAKREHSVRRRVISLVVGIPLAIALIVVVLASSKYGYALNNSLDSYARSHPEIFASPSPTNR